MPLYCNVDFRNDGANIELSLLEKDTGVPENIPEEFRLGLRKVSSEPAPDSKPKKKKVKKKEEKPSEKSKSKKRKAELKEEKLKKRKVLDAHEIDSGVDTDSDAEVKVSWHFFP